MLKWKAIFYTSCLLVIMELVQLVNIKVASLFEVGCLVLHLLTLVSLYGYIHSKAIGTQWMARRVWFLNLLTILCLTVVLGFLVLLAEPMESETVVFLSLAYIFGLITLVPIYRYAYKCDNSWAAALAKSFNK